MVISKFTTLLYYSCKIKRVSAWLGVWNPSKCHQQWPMAKCQSQDGKPFEKELPLSLVSLASTLATFVFGGLQMCPRFPPNWHQLTIHDQLKRRHAYFVAWVMPLPVGYISRGGRGYIINVWQHTSVLGWTRNMPASERSMLWTLQRDCSKQIFQSGATQHLLLPQPRVTACA